MLNAATSLNDIANGFNKFFTNIGPNLANKIKTSQTPFESFMPQSNQSNMYLNPTTETEIINIVKNINSKTSYDVDGLNMTLVKQVMNAVISPFTHICNSSFLQGIFPDKMLQK